MSVRKKEEKSLNWLMQQFMTAASYAATGVDLPKQRANEEAGVRRDPSPNNCTHDEWPTNSP
jgi:hypothetical protein